MPAGATEPGARFLLQAWPEGVVVFDTQFGHTHAMDTVNAWVWQALLAAPDTPDDQLLRACPAALALDLDRLKLARTQLQALDLLP